MQADIRATAEYAAMAALYTAIRAPGERRISDISDVSASPDGSHAAFVGTVFDDLEGQVSTQIYELALADGTLRALTSDREASRAPKFDPRGRMIAFLSERERSGNLQLSVLDRETNARTEAPPVDGWIEYLHWSPDGTRLLLGVAAHGADISGGQGAVTSIADGRSQPTWQPALDIGDESRGWRRAWIYDVAANTVAVLPCGWLNIWEAQWCGDQAIAAIASAGPREGDWYQAALYHIALAGGPPRCLYMPRDQLGWVSASRSGNQVAIVEALCSDRLIVAGQLLIIDVEDGTTSRADTDGIEVTCTEWRSDRLLLLAGHLAGETVIGTWDDGDYKLLWSDSELTGSGRYITVSGFGERGDCMLIVESFTRSPALAVLRGTELKTVRGFDAGYEAVAGAIASVSLERWTAKCGLPIAGWLLLPSGEGPFPLIVNIHGGPVWHWRPHWLGRQRSAPFLQLVQLGYAVFLPNPRGSGGHGQDFARQVVGDFGGADAQDILAGIDHLTARRVVDASRIALTGVSYGGFMTAWLVTQDKRFAAAAAVAPIANHVTSHLLSNIPEFVRLFLPDGMTTPDGLYHRRSPIMHAAQAITPTLSICGALDRCTPPEEAAQFHNALKENGVRSVLVTYPQEGHGIAGFPAAIDYGARLLLWFDAHLSQ